jgi:ribosomal protein L7/L12
MIYKSLRAAAVVAFMFVSTLTKAQPVVTEYFQVSETFKIDMKDKKTRESIFTKGVVDAEWQSDKRTFAISYNPYQTDIDAAIKSIKEKAGASLMTAKNRLFTSLTRF